MSSGSSPVADSTRSSLWRFGTTLVISATGILSKAFLRGASSTEVHGLDNFLRILDERESGRHRTRGLITVSNHVSIIDDPLIWGALPLRYMFTPSNLRWSLGSYDIVFQNKALSTFFTLGQVLPTHRLAHSKFGGLFQPTVGECIRLLSRPRPPHYESQLATRMLHQSDPPDPFTDPTAPSPASIHYSTNGTDSFPAPSLSQPALNAHSWIHIFPEGRIHQHPTHALRYFKWGIARLILESEPMPQIVPIWVEGLEDVMHESRQTPRFIPRPGKKVKIVFGDEVNAEEVFGDLRHEWQKLVREEQSERPESFGSQRLLPCDSSHAEKDSLHEREGYSSPDIGFNLSSRLKHSPEAVQLRIEVTRRIREQILKLRREQGWPDEDPKSSFAETWKEEGGPNRSREGKMKDDSWVKDV